MSFSQIAAHLLLKQGVTADYLIIVSSPHHDRKGNEADFYPLPAGIQAHFSYGRENLGL